MNDSDTFPARLTDGYRAFLGDRFARERSRYETLAEGQAPEVMVIGCCDSRVSPEVIFDASPGELFVARNVANLVPPFETQGDYHGTSAALEFAVQALRVKHIVVLGHARCGGIRAFADDTAPLSPGDFIGRWMNLIKPARASSARRRAISSVSHAPRTRRRREQPAQSDDVSVREDPGRTGQAPVAWSVFRRRDRGSAGAQP